MDKIKPELSNGVKISASVCPGFKDGSTLNGYLIVLFCINDLINYFTKGFAVVDNIFDVLVSLHPKSMDVYVL